MISVRRRLRAAEKDDRSTCAHDQTALHFDSSTRGVTKHRAAAIASAVETDCALVRATPFAAAPVELRER